MHWSIKNFLVGIFCPTFFTLVHIFLFRRLGWIKKKLKDTKGLRGHQKPKIDEGETKQCPKERRHCSTQKTFISQNEPHINRKVGDGRRGGGSGRISSPCSTSNTRRVRAWVVEFLMLFVTDQKSKRIITDEGSLCPSSILNFRIRKQFLPRMVLFIFQ